MAEDSSPTLSLPLLLEPEQLANILPDLLALESSKTRILIIDQSKFETYQERHIPGAIHLDFKRLQQGQAPTPGALPSLEQLSQVFSELGLTKDTHVICYDDEGGGWAGRLIWVLDSIGHSSYSYVNGGITAWVKAGLATESGQNIATESNYQVTTIDDSFSFTKEQILAQLNDPDFAVWDARSAKEYSGEKVISKRGGHIPGAVNYEWTLGMDQQNGLKINPLDDFRSLLASMGLDETKRIATHCQTHHRSGFTYLVGKILGFDIRGYAGSWAEWGDDDELPVEKS
ncbi:MAG: rhodanese-like domain-containing protein [Oleibacter sp.]|nr:rhodanese-like domain-containing protein [Thalassolituus sp.]